MGKMMTIPNLMIINLLRIVVSLLGTHQIMVIKIVSSKRIGGGGEEEEEEETGIKEDTTIEVGIIEGDMVIEEDSINKTMDIMDTVMVMVDMEVDGNEKEIYVIELFYFSIFLFTSLG